MLLQQDYSATFDNTSTNVDDGDRPKVGFTFSVEEAENETESDQLKQQYMMIKLGQS